MKRLLRSYKLKVPFMFVLCLGGFVSTSGAQAASPPTVKPHLHQLRIEELSRSVLAFDIASGSDIAAAALSDLHVRVWRLGSGQVVHELSFPEPPTDKQLRLDGDVEPISLHFSPDGKILAVGFLNAIHLYNVDTWTEQERFDVLGEDRLRADIIATPQTPQAPQLKRRAAEQAQAQSEKPIPDINQTMREWAAHRHQGDGRTRIRDFAFARDEPFIVTSYCRGACWSSSGQVVAFPSGMDVLRLWDMRTTKMVWEKSYDPQGVISRIVALPDGSQFIAVDSQLGHCAVGAYDLRSGQTLWTHELGPCLGPPSILILPDGRSFISNRVEEANRKNEGWRYAAVYETATGRKIADLPDTDGIGDADISSDGRWLVSVTWRGTQVQIWDLQTKKVLIKDVPKGWKRTADCVLNRVRLSPDNRWLVVGCNARGDVAIYNWGEEKRLKP